MARRILWISGLLAVLSLFHGCGDAPSEKRPGVPSHPVFRHLRLSESGLAGTAVGAEPRQDTRELERGEPSPDSLHRLGVRRLAAGEFQRSILTLEGLTLQQPATAATLSDLAAAYLSRGQSEKRPFDFVLALSAAERALEAAPGLPEALFNRAEALTHLQLTGQAIEAWEAYRQADSHSAWSADAQSHIDELKKPTLAEVWEREQPRLQAALARTDPHTVEEIVSALPDHARLWAEEELLTAWAEDRSLPGGLDPISAARQIGTALHDRAGDAMIFDAVAAIERAGKAQGRLPALQRGHLLFRQALQRYNDRDFQEARPLLVAAGKALAAGGSPFASWTALHRHL